MWLKYSGCINWQDWINSFIIKNYWTSKIIDSSDFFRTNKFTNEAVYILPWNYQIQIEFTSLSATYHHKFYIQSIETNNLQKKNL